jgi:hypothetical protein
MVFASCLGCHRTSPPVPDRGRTEGTPPASERDRGETVAEPTASVTGNGTSPQHGRPADAGAPGCRVVRGPAPLPRSGPANLLVRGDTIEILQNDDGRPRVTIQEAGPFTASSSSEGPSLREADGTSAKGGVVNVDGTSAKGGVVNVEAMSAVGGVVNGTDGAAARGLAVACARAEDAAFCPDRSGSVRRVALRDGRDDTVVASSRSGSRVAAGVLGTRAALAYLASRRTSEGWLSEAWLAVEDDPPMRLSEEGSGATSLALARYGDGLLALMVDARAALTALHARVIVRDGRNDERTSPGRAPHERTRLGEDVVVFVGGPGDRRSGAEVVFPPSGPGWGLLPIARDMATFGLAVVRLDQPPRVDEPVVWSMYANGLDPAGLAAAVDGTAAEGGVVKRGDGTSAEGGVVSARGGLTWLARIVPRGPEPSAPRVLELGQVDSQGAFLARGTLSTADSPGDVALAIDSRHAIWVAWVDRKGAWIERLMCR